MANRGLTWVVGGLIVGMTPSVAEAANTRLCFRYPGSAYGDASPHLIQHNCNDPFCPDEPPGSTVTCSQGNCEYDFGEDLGFTTGLWKVRRAYVIVQAADGTFDYLGHLNSGGCTPNLDASEGPFTVLINADYESSATDVRFEVEDCAGSSCGIASLTITGISPSNPPAAKTTTTLPISGAFSIYTVMAYSVDRLLPGVFGSGWHDFEVEFDPNSGNAASWNDTTDVPRVVVGGSDAALSKYKPIHEMAHAFQLDAVQPGSNANAQATFVDCSNGQGGASNHTVGSFEFSSCADIEGFAHYMSAATWNNLGNGANGVWMDWGADGVQLFNQYVRYDIEHGNQEILAQGYCTGSPSCCGYGVELDWARTFWDYRTNGSSGKPGNMDMLSVYADAYPYAINGTSCSAGHYDDILDSITSLFGLPFGLRFFNMADYNGSDW